MLETRSRNIVAALLGGALMAVATPAIAHAQAPTKADVTPFAVGDGKVGLRDHKSQMLLQPAGGSSTQGAKVVQEPKVLSGTDLTAVQNWAISSDGDYYIFTNTKTKKALGLDGGRITVGTGLIQATPDGTSNQEWQFRTYSGYPAKVYRLVNRKNTNMCAGILDASTTHGVQAAIFTCDGSNNQGWEVVDG